MYKSISLNINRLPYKQDVGGSNPSLPTNFKETQTFIVVVLGFFNKNNGAFLQRI